ncbi:MAG: NUDIX hydrolase [Synergistales bacterium]|nr:NUDIX hydrolase [Synergistales bacterium]
MIAFEKPVSRNILYRGRILNLRVDKVEFPNSKRTSREVIEHEAAVGIIPITQDDHVILVKQYRYAVSEALLEIPAGIVEKGEDPVKTASRELREETGYDAEKLTEIGRFYTSPGFSNELLILYLAESLFPSKLQEDEDEFIEVLHYPFSELDQNFLKEKVRDGKTFAALSWLISVFNQ